MLAKDGVGRDSVSITELAGKAGFVCIKSARLNNNETVFILKNN